MYLFRRVLNRVNRWFQRKDKTNFTLDIHTLRSLQFIAEREQRTPEDIANQILNDVLRQHQAQEESWSRWESLTPREQEITALICLGYTSRQVASKLYISPETVKTHVEHVLMKFDISDRNALRMLLSGWDFTAWDR